LNIAYNKLSKHYHWSNTLVMQENGLLRYITLTVGRGYSLYNGSLVTWASSRGVW